MLARIATASDRCTGEGMADNGDIKAHVSTYDRVIGMLKWGTVACFLLAALVVWLIS